MDSANRPVPHSPVYPAGNGSAIENSGIDDFWVEAELSSPTTVRQVLEGKHVKHALDVHTITLQGLLDKFTKQHATFSSHKLLKFYSTHQRTLTEAKCALPMVKS